MVHNKNVATIFSSCPKLYFLLKLLSTRKLLYETISLFLKIFHFAKKLKQNANTQSKVHFRLVTRGEKTNVTAQLFDTCGKISQSAIFLLRQIFDSIHHHFIDNWRFDTINQNLSLSLIFHHVLILQSFKLMRNGGLIDSKKF